MLALICSACSEQRTRTSPSATSATVGAGWTERDPPAGQQAFAPHLAAAEGGALLTWLERLEAAGGARRHRVLFARLADGAWSPPAVVAEGDDLFANWADFPGVVQARDGTLVVHWLAKTATATYAYSIHLARSVDGGATWSTLGRLNDDATDTEHGFVSYVAESEGVRAFWLDGRQTAEGGAMTLRTALIGSTVGSSEELDDRVCDCCSTGAAMTANGPAVVYRDRDLEEVRDIAIIGRQGERWRPRQAVAVDDWEIPGCPVNGPEIAVAGERSAVAWFTAAGGEPATKVAFSADSGVTFGEAFVVDHQGPLGRVDVVLEGGDALVSWLADAGDSAEIRLRRVSADGRMGPAVAVTKISAARASGFPRLVGVGDRLYLGWVELGGEKGDSRVRVREIAAAAIPAAG